MKNWDKKDSGTNVVTVLNQRFLVLLLMNTYILNVFICFDSTEYNKHMVNLR